MPGALEEGRVDDVAVLEVVNDFLQSLVSPLKKTLDSIHAGPLVLDTLTRESQIIMYLVDKIQWFS